MNKQESGNGTGFLITCDKNKQKQAVKDAYNFLNEVPNSSIKYIEDLYGDIETSLIHKQLEKQGKDHDLKNEMSVRSALKNKLKVLTTVETHVNCLIFIKINETLEIPKIDPYKVVNKIMEDVHKQGRQVTRFCHKIMPVERSFKAEHFKMLDEIDSIFQGRDNSEMKSWALNFKCRNNSKFNYKQVLGKTDEIAKKYGHFVDIYYPQWTVSIEIANHLMCLSIVENFKQYEEFRLHKKGRKIQFQAHPKPEIIRQKKQFKNEMKKKKNMNQEQKEKEAGNKIQADKEEQDNEAKIVEDVPQNNELLHQQIQPVNDDDDVDFV